jgi:hypothetical protein
MKLCKLDTTKTTVFQESQLLRQFGWVNRKYTIDGMSFLVLYSVSKLGGWNRNFTASLSLYLFFKKKEKRD